MGKRGKEKSLYSLCCLDSQTKRIACCKLRLSGPSMLTEKYEFRAQLQISPFEQKYMGRLYLACVSISIMNSYCCTVVIPRFTTGRRFMQFHSCGNYLERLGFWAVLFVMTALLLCTFSVPCLLPIMPPASQETKVSPSPSDCLGNVMQNMCDLSIIVRPI